MRRTPGRKPRRSCQASSRTASCTAVYPGTHGRIRCIQLYEYRTRVPDTKFSILITAVYVPRGSTAVLLALYRIQPYRGSTWSGEFRSRITVTFSIFNFSTWFFAQIVENREGRLSIPFLGPGDKFSKDYDENQIRSEGAHMGPRARAAVQVAGAMQLPYRSDFVILVTFRKVVPMT
jgi:hypothetical protein